MVAASVSGRMQLFRYRARFEQPIATAVLLAGSCIVTAGEASHPVVPVMLQTATWYGLAVIGRLM